MELKGFITLDVETTTTTSFKRKANPFDKSNWVVYVGTKEHPNAPAALRYHEPNRDWLVDVLDRKPAILITMNGKFDLLHGIVQSERGLAAWMNWVAAGGVVWDIQLAEYLLGGMLPELHMLSLDEIAPLYGGEIKVDEVKALWQSGVETFDIPEDLITRYLHGDCNNTEKVFLGQLKRARDCGQMKSLLLNMGAMLYIIEVERNGMFVDKELGLKLAAELTTELEALTARLNGYIPPDLPLDDKANRPVKASACGFSWTSRTHVSALIFGGTLKYTIKEPILDDEMKYVYHQKDATWYVCEDGTLTPDMLAPGVAFYKSGKNEGQPKTKKVKVPDYERGPKIQNVEKLYKLPGFTTPDKKWESVTPGVYSTAAEVIELLGNRNIPFLQDLAKHAKMEKDLGTYYIKTDADGKQTGMLTLVQPDGIIHHKVNQTNTVTGRLSSSDPNLQTVPKGDKSKVKQVFRSRFTGGSIIQSDFTALEIYIQAILTGDKQLIADLLEGLDMHCSRVATVYKIDYAEVVRLVKEVADELWIGRRSKAKNFSFQRAYGAGAAAIAESTGMDIEEVKALIAAEMLRYPEMEPFYEGVTAAIVASRRGIRKTIPHPDFPAKIVELRTGYYRTPDNKLYSYIEQPAPKFVVERSGVWTSFSPPEIKNYIVQGSGAEWAKAAMWLAVRLFYKHGNVRGQALLVNQVHDACYADAAPEARDQAAAMLHAAMECASDFIEWYFGWPLPVKVPSETTAGSSMADDGKLPEVRAQAEQYKTEIRESFFK